jgi:hypothetical protein
MGNPFYNYVIAGNGVFIRAERDVMSATIQISECEIRGLPPIEPEFNPSFGKVPEAMLNRIINLAVETAKCKVEGLFYLSLQSSEWQLEIPRQIQTRNSVKPCEQGSGSPYQRAIIEIHTHPFSKIARFSSDDNEDETGFRIYGVMANLNPRNYRPTLNLRLGVYGYWWRLPADRIFEMPSRLHDHNLQHHRSSLSQHPWDHQKTMLRTQNRTRAQPFHTA